MTIRSIVSTKEAGIVIGKAGASVSHIRQVAGVKIGVSKVVPGISERILTISGSASGIAQAYAMIAKNILDAAGSPTHPSPSDSEAASIRLLVSHQLVGSIIGKAGAKIREIQETANAKIVVSKEMLPQSTERVVEIHGSVDAINRSIGLVAQSIRTDGERPPSIIPYDPQYALRSRDMYPRRYNPHPRASNDADQPQTSRSLSVPSDMVGCIIGKNGSFINQIRRLSGARLHIADQLEGRTDREVTITGTEHSTQKALNLLYNQLESEKVRRLKHKHASPITDASAPAAGPADPESADSQEQEEN